MSGKFQTLRRFSLLLTALCLLFLTACGVLQDAIDTLPDTPVQTATTTVSQDPAIPAEDGEYDSRDDVAAYLYYYGHLPSNYITKAEAQALGWSGGSLEPYAPGKSIGGGYFGNYEGLLPEKKGRTYSECDIDTRGKKSRGAKRIVYSNDGLIYYMGDHYENFPLLYGDDTA
ncbi:MAG: ribonuclease [Clostridia bacterium]|nr:ribonuclease [Clostridia bacterium]